MGTHHKPRVLVLGGNFAGLTAARFIREQCGDAVDITVVDRKPYLIFVPNIGIEVLANHDPAATMHLDVVRHLDHDRSTFVQGEVQEIDLEKRHVAFVPTERPGAAPERVAYDYLVVALGARLAYDHIEGFGQYGHTVSDSYYGNKLRRYLFEGGYKGGPIAIGSARFHQGKKGNPDWLPISGAACDGPPLELALALATWLAERKLGGPDMITLFSPATIIAEDAGEKIVKTFLSMAGEMGFHYERDTPDVQQVFADGMEFSNGKSLDAELKIIFPDWEPHSFIKSLPIVDEAGFIVTDLTMRNVDYPDVFAIGDCAALTVPKLGAHGHKQAEIVARQIAKDVGKMTAEDADEPFWPEILCFGDMGRNKAFYIHSDAWYGGDISVFKMGYVYYAMKMAFKEMYFRTGGKVPSWGMSLSEVLAEKIM
jgi:sulfide:quinone oxidoreductase